MNFQMLLKISSLSESFPTDFTFVWLLLKMHPGMVDEIPSLFELLLAALIVSLNHSIIPARAFTFSTDECMCIFFDNSITVSLRFFIKEV
ncbi:unnamed protein product [Moneuplotes crassus]|uniref:Uncharacterized protein n=1 Tax=Euplotes crassus TaxID=5936 RepID=A0AAD1UNZ2_EUPCR|nr:unnamed protein product [Moneuplotes crassus]